MTGYVEYLNKLIEIIEKVRDTQHEAFSKASEIIVEAFRNGKKVHYWGPGGHSSIFAEDVLAREGELLYINPILDPNISLSHGALKEICYFERIEEIGNAIVRVYDIEPGDVVVIGSAYGVNPVCIQGAIACKNAGATVIAITSHYFSDHLHNDDTRHACGKGLNEIADIYINSYSPYDDLLLERDDFDQKYGPVGTICQLLTLKALNTTVITKMIDSKMAVPIGKNALEKGSAEFNEIYLEEMWHQVKAM